MGLQHVWRSASVLVAIVALAGCGAPATVSTLTTAKSSEVLEAKAVPPQSAFKTFKVKVIRILPEDNHGLTHQNFVVEAVTPNPGKEYEVNNSTTHGTKVPNLKVGALLEIRGTVYEDDKGAGIHWTHMADKPGDAGYIKTADGKIYQ